MRKVLAILVCAFLTGYAMSAYAKQDRGKDMEYAVGGFNGPMSGVQASAQQKPLNSEMMLRLFSQAPS